MHACHELCGFTIFTAYAHSYIAMFFLTYKRHEEDERNRRTETATSYSKR